MLPLATNRKPQAVATLLNSVKKKSDGSTLNHKIVCLLNVIEDSSKLFLPFTDTFYRLFSQMDEINPKDLGHVPSGVPG